jgi:regulation of enolase protein 1 (concanavalin A-like superfamily)
MKKKLELNGDELTLYVSLDTSERDRSKAKEVRFTMRMARKAAADAGHEILSIVKKGDVRNFGTSALSKDTFVFKVRVEQPKQEVKISSKPKTTRKKATRRAFSKKTKEG